MSARLTDRLFSKNEVNCGRQRELDIARAIIIFCLPLIHCVIECTSEEGLAQGIPYLFDTIIGGPFSAPMYMFVMGVGMTFTRKNTPVEHLKRGIRIFVAGYILNIFRFLIPYIIGYALTGEYEKYIVPLLYKVLGNDILIFAGLAMMIMALFLRVNMSNVTLMLIGILSSFVGTLVIGVDVKVPLGNIFLGYLIGTEDAAGMVLSDFPVLNWLIFPICGYVFGVQLKRVKDKKRFYLSLSLPAMFIAVIYFAYGLHHKIGMFGEGQNCYYHMSIADALASLFLTVGMIGLYYAISNVLPDCLMKLSREISENITFIYCIHWVLVSIIVNVFLYVVRGTQELSAGMVVLLGSMISIISILCARYVRRWKEG